MRKLMLFATFASLCLAQQKKAAPKMDPPLQIPANVEVRRDLVYTKIGARELHLDLYLPKSGSGSFPAVVYVHGGGWSGGNKSAFSRQAAHMAAKGFVGACVEYRLSGEAQYPAALDDVKAAIRWMRANAATYRVRPDRIGAAGGSAGGHLVALAGVTGKGDTAVQAVAAFNPAVDFLDFGKRAGNGQNSVSKFLGKTYTEDPKLWESASPLAQVHKNAPPFLFLHGTADPTVPYKQSTDMQAALQKLGVKAELFSAPDAVHGFFNRPPWFEPTLRRMEQFFFETLAK
ncbi:MAG: alpha/beta hydrolase [Bryobacteraceae bacterium]|nr:alpha/beta hydrolase [Bryobacteraceae bacterium]